MNCYQEIEQITEAYRAGLPEPKRDWPPKVQKAFACISANLFKSQLSVGWMKEQCEINGKSFAGHFSKYLYRPPKEYILHHRIQISKEILKQTEASVTAVAVSVGFNSLSAFCKAFKRRENIRPTEWRSHI